jgi:hypothetical protein
MDTARSYRKENNAAVMEVAIDKIVDMYMLSLPKFARLAANSNRG